MTTITGLTHVATPMTNRFEAFHHHRKLNPAFYETFEAQVLTILGRTTGVISPRLLIDLMIQEFGSDAVVTYTPDRTNVYKAMLSWFRHRNPTTVTRFRRRKTEASRAKGTTDWAKLSLNTVDWNTIIKLVHQLRLHSEPTTLVIVKAEAGVKFNQNFNAEVSSYIRERFEDVARLLPVKKAGLR